MFYIVWSVSEAFRLFLLFLLFFSSSCSSSSSSWLNWLLPSWRSSSGNTWVWILQTVFIIVTRSEGDVLTRGVFCLGPVNQRVFQPGAQASLPRSEQHRRLYIHLERHHDHGEPSIFTITAPLIPLHQRPSPSCCSSSRRVSVYSSTAVASAAPRTSRRVSSGSSAPVRWSLRPVARGTVTLELAAWSSVWAAAWPSDTTRSLQETPSSH